MASPYNGPEIMELQSSKIQNSQSSENENKQTIKKQTIPKESKEIIDLFGHLVDTPDNIDKLWNFTTKYLTYLEAKSDMINPFFSNESHNQSDKPLVLLLSIKESSIKDVPWGIYNCFLTISNIGSSIAQKETLDEKDDFYIKYVMLAFGENSPIFQFTQLLQTLQKQEPQTQQVYSTLNSKFLEAFEKYEKKPSNKSKQIQKKKNSMLDKSFKIAGKEISAKVLIIVLIVILLIIGIGMSAFYYNKTTNIIEFIPKEVGPHTSVKPESIVSSVYSS